MRMQLAQNKIAVSDVKVAEKPQVRRVPVLRFPEFSGEWEEKKLNELGKFISGQGFPDAEQGGKEGIPFYKVSDMNLSLNKIWMRVSNNYVTQDQIKKRRFKVIEKPSIIFAKVGAAIFLERKRIAENFIIDNNMMSFTPDCDLAFVKYIFDITRISRFAQVGALPSYNASDLSIIKVKIPREDEQKKIAEFLGVVDEKIERILKKKVALERYKKGVMQKIFSQQTRFRDENGNVYPNWEEKKLEEIMVESRAKGSAGDVARKLTVKLWGRGVFEKSDKSVGSINTQYYKRSAGQFIYSKLDFLNCAFGIIPVSLDGFESTIDLPAFDIKDGYISEFILERVKQKDFYKRFGETADGSRKAKRIHVDVFLSFMIAIPSYPEQKKIVEFLASLDEKLSAVSTQLSRTKEFKKGLLQQMFI